MVRDGVARACVAGRRWVAIVALAGGIAHAGVSAPVRPTGRDLSLKWTSGTYAYLWYPLSGAPHAASQAERDAMEWTLFARTLEVMRAVGDLCPAETRYAYSQLNVVTTRVGVGSQYEGAIQRPGGKKWEVGPNGRHYSVERSILKKFRECLRNARARATCATRLGASATMVDLRDLLDLNTSCDGPADFVLPPVPETVDRKRTSMAPVDTRKRALPITGEQASLLHATHAAHSQVSKWRCGEGSAPAPGIVAAAHVRYEASARTEAEGHFFAMKPFSGYQDPRWTADEACRWARIQDVFHEQWMEAQAMGDWAAARRADTDHLFAHLCMNDASPRLRVLFSCGNAQYIDACGKKTCVQALQVLTEDLGL